MPTGNGGITQGLALRLTNMEQGRREVTANQFRREQMDALNEQRKAAADYRKALAEQKEAARQEKQISELQKSINVKGIAPIYSDVAGKDVAAFMWRVIEGKKKVENYTSSGEYLRDYEDLMGRQKMRVISSNNMLSGDKKVSKNSDDYELKTDMAKALQDLDYPAFVASNGGSDYVMTDGNIQPKFNKKKVTEVMSNFALENEPVLQRIEKQGGFTMVVPYKNMNTAKLAEMQQTYLNEMAAGGMNNNDFIKYAEGVREVRNELEGTIKEEKPKTFKDGRSVAEELALSQGKLNQKTAYNATKAANANKFTAAKRAGGTTYTSPDVIIDVDVASNGDMVIYKSIGKSVSVPMIPMPEGSMVENKDGKLAKADMLGVIVDPQYHFIKDGQVVLYGQIETYDKTLNKMVKSELKKIVMPNDPTLAPKAAVGINKQTKNALNVSFDTATGKYSYDIDEQRTEAQPKGGGNSTSGNKTAPTNTKPAGGGQKKAAPKKGKATKPFNNSLNIQ